MNQPIKELLASAADDQAHPLGFTPSAVTVRARRAARRRTVGRSVVATAVLVGLAGVVVGTDVVGPDPSTVRPADDPTGPIDPSDSSDPNPPSAAPTATAKPGEQAVIDRCIDAQQASSAEPPETSPGTRGTYRARPGSDGAQSYDSETTVGSLSEGWVLDAVARDEQGATATFVAPDLRQFAVCELYDAGIGAPDAVSSPRRLDDGPVPENWYGDEGFKNHPTADWVQVCAGGEGKACSRELFHGGFALHAGVAEVLIDAPDGERLRATLGAHTYVFRHVEERVDPDRAANDMQALPSVPVTLVDASGSPIITYDYFPSYLLPEHCADNPGGC